MSRTRKQQHVRRHVHRTFARRMFTIPRLLPQRAQRISNRVHKQVTTLQSTDNLFEVWTMPTPQASSAYSRLRLWPRGASCTFNGLLLCADVLGGVPEAVCSRRLQHRARAGGCNVWRQQIRTPHLFSACEPWICCALVAIHLYDGPCRRRHPPPRSVSATSRT